ncbi:DMT family transporter [Enterococcus timonensis]|uniref:DMT family transporter n=1 Tax=Enterococcus timonensis TaxID=1852364 RepID=UPI0008DA12E7|nr:DMT family transporter [Enterococcus timonensis]
MNNKITSEGKGIATGLAGGLLWGLDTVLVGVILAMSPLSGAVALAPLVSTFLHDFFSSIWMLIYTAFHKNLKNFIKSWPKRSGRFVTIAALFGGPIGMTGYMLSIRYIGASNTAIISAMYPAVGAFFGYLFLKERMSKRGFLGLAIAMGATMILGFTSPEAPQNIVLGILFALLCVFGWGMEAVITAYGMKNDLLPDLALQIRQLVSALVYGIFIIPIIGGYPLVLEIIQSPAIIVIALTALAGTSSYLCYYRSIDSIGAIKAMGLNISYSAWAIFIGIFFGNGISFKEVILAVLIIAGSILTTDNPKEFLQIFILKPKKSTEI